MTLEIVSQIIGIAGMAANVGSLQFKNVRWLCAVQIIGQVCFIVSYGLLGAVAGMLFNLYGLLLRGLLLFGGERLYKVWVLCGLFGFLIGCTVVAYQTESWLALIPFFGQVAGTVGLWTRNAWKLRVLQLTAASPLWLIYNGIVFSLGGIGCEVFTILSTLISIFRYGPAALRAENAAPTERKDD